MNNQDLMQNGKCGMRNIYLNKTKNTPPGLSLFKIYSTVCLKYVLAKAKFNKNFLKRLSNVHAHIMLVIKHDNMC